MNAFAHRVPLALSLVSFASLLAGCNRATSPAIPASSSHFTTPHANARGIKIWAAIRAEPARYSVYRRAQNAFSTLFRREPAGQRR